MRRGYVMAELIRKIRYSDITQEEESNLTASVALVCVCVTLLAALFLNEIGLFQIESERFNIAVIICEVLLILPAVLARTTDMSSKAWFKYFIMFCAFAAALTVATLLAFHGILILFIPIFVSLIYYDRRIHFAGIASAALVALLSPVISVRLDTLSMSFWYFIICVFDPKSIDPIVATNELNANFVKLFRDDLPDFLTVFCGLPQAMVIAGFGVMALLLINYRQRIKFKQLNEIEDIQSHVLLSLSDIIENRDMDTGGHVKRAKDLVEILVSHLGRIPQDDNPKYREYLIKAAITHDLGKIAVDDNLLRKTNRVTEEEYEAIKLHPIKSVEIINAVLGPIEDEEFIKIAVNLAKYHHERYDGTGYPEGIKGKDIPFEARIMAIADVYDALITERCYHDTVTHEEAYEIIKEGMGTQFDPDLMQLFDDSFDEMVRYYEAANK